MPLPHVEAAKFAAPRRSPLVPESSDDIEKAYVNMVVALLSWLHLGKPAVAPAHMRMGALLSDSQAETVARLTFAIHHRSEQHY